MSMAQLLMLPFFGRYPNILSDLESAGQSALTDTDGNALNASRHAIRLRELAIETIVQAHAAERLRRAETSHTRPAGELADLKPNGLVDIFRQPSNKDLVGWRGPATIIDTSSIPDGTITVRWGGRTMITRIQDIRKTCDVHCIP